MNKSIRLFSRVGMVFLLLSLNALAQDIIIGQVAPLSGVLGDTGKEMVLGVKVYFDHVNATGGIRGKKIKHIVKDDAYVVADTVRLTREVIEQDRAVALIGFAGTGNIGELLKQNVLADARIALVAPYSGGDPLRTPFNPNIFHIRAGYADEAEEMVKQLDKQELKRIAVMYQDDPFGKSGLAGVDAALKKRNVPLIASAGYEKNTDNVTEAVKNLAAALPQAVIMISINKSTGAFIKQFRDVAPGVQLFNISVVNPKELARLAGDEKARGVGIAQVMPYPYSPAIAIVKEYQQLMAKYAPGKEFSYTSLEEFIGAKVLVAGLRKVGPNPTREKVVKALETLNKYDVGGFTVSFAPDNRIGSRFVEVTIIGRNGSLLH